LLLKVLSSLAIASMIIAEFALAALTALAVGVEEFAVLSVPGSTSNGPPAVPSAFTPPVYDTPENAMMDPIAKSALLLGDVGDAKLKVMEEPSVPSATR
jgi:hypothetical protein